jgi:hypothetical protein
MADSAAHLVDEVLPKRPIRQWVLSVPFPLRYLLATNPPSDEPRANHCTSRDQHLFDKTVGEDGEVRDAKRCGDTDTTIRFSPQSACGPLTYISTCFTSMVFMTRMVTSGR